MRTRTGGPHVRANTRSMRWLKIESRTKSLGHYRMFLRVTTHRCKPNPVEAEWVVSEIGIKRGLAVNVCSVKVKGG